MPCGDGAGDGAVHFEANKVELAPDKVQFATDKVKLGPITVRLADSKSEFTAPEVRTHRPTGRDSRHWSAGLAASGIRGLRRGP